MSAEGEPTRRDDSRVGRVGDPEASGTFVPAGAPFPEQVVFPSQTVKSTVPVGAVVKTPETVALSCTLEPIAA